MNNEKEPLPLPGNFDPQVNLPSREENGNVFHATISGMNLAAQLIEHGTPLDMERAEKVLDAVFESQERRAGAPHYGNFTWEREDEMVEDLNAVHFTIMPLIKTMLHCGDAVPASLRDKALAGIRLGLEAIARIDVHLRYTTIAAADVFDTCIGGELLNDAAIMARGRDKLRRWLAFTDRSGTFYEYNCPGYTGMSIERLAELAALSNDEQTRTIARVFAVRAGLSALLHGHPGTGRWSGPFSRAYQQQVAAKTPPEIDWMRHWLESGILPAWAATALEDKTMPLEIKETSDAAGQQMMTTYMHEAFSLGVASKDLSSQANRFVEGESSVFIAQFTCGEETGVLLSKYILDEKWLGDFRTTPSRSNTQLQPDEGRFWGVQDKTRAIGLYAPRVIGARQPCSGLKLALIWMRRDLVDEIWIGDRKVETLPADVPEGATVVVGSGQVWTAVRPLTRTHLSHNPPLRLVEHQGNLALEIYNYEGMAKTFWELGWPGSFYQGMPQCGFYAEVALRDAYSDGAEFAQIVAGGQLCDEVEAPFTYDGGDEERLWNIEYERDGRSLGIAVDLMQWKLKQRWTEDGDQGWPMLESPLAQQTSDGKVEVAGAVLECGKAAAWILASSERRCWVAAYHGPEAAPLVFQVPEGKVEIESMGTGMVIWDNGRVRIEANDVRGTPKVEGGELAS
ncbi:MAG TPA: hypothetical protein EYG11_23145 [Candidatus Latescibacteria bacterium]|nr:hypothetical protein [Candidatus Latescibacterota bacterium]